MLTQCMKKQKKKGWKEGPKEEKIFIKKLYKRKKRDIKEKQQRLKKGQ